MTEQRDWLAWHEPYDDPGSDLSRRLATVQAHLRRALEDCPEGPIRLVSMCAGQGHDVLGVLTDHPRGGDVTARLVELDGRNVAAARSVVDELGLGGVELVEADAGTTDVYAGAVPAHVVLACGTFGNVTDEDIRTTIATLPSLCARDATVLWTRHRVPPDATPWIRSCFAEHGFEELAFEGPADTVYGVGVHRLRADPAPFAPGRRLFTFVGH